MNVLAIGNSFSDDALRYLHDIARADGAQIETANLYIGGCSLERHFRNMLSDKRDYELQYNGHKTRFFVSMSEGLLNRPWDVITLQQQSYQATRAETYRPYISALVEYVHKCCPKAKIFIHQTWAYEEGSAKLLEVAKYEKPEQMLSDVVNSYSVIAKEIGANGIIPAGEMLGMLSDNGIEKIHRDTFHASRGLGRYAIGLIWYRALTGRTVSENTFCDFDEEVSAEEVAIAKRCADSFDLSKYVFNA